MKTLDKNKLKTILIGLNATIKGRKLYPKGHPAIMRGIEREFTLIEELLEVQSPLILGKVKDVLVFGHQSFIDPPFKELKSGLESNGIEGIIFEKGLNLKEFTDFVDEIFSDSSLDVKGLQKEMVEKGILHITLKVLPTKERFMKVYQNAVDVIKDTMGDIRLGMIPKTGVVMNVVEDMTECVMEDKNAMVGLTMIKDYDNYLFTHSVNVSLLSVAFGKSIGLDTSSLHQIGLAAILHDVGKTGVGEHIIRKPGSLNEEEWEKIKEHPMIGYEIVKNMEGIGELTPRMVLEHHIGYDMQGYPSIDKTNKPHNLSMIITISDTYDAVTTMRTYQGPMEPMDAIETMQSLAGKRLDPDYLKKFIKMLGVYPVGTLVRLSTNEVGVVVKANPEDDTRPVVKIIFDNGGKKLGRPHDIDLSGDLPGGGDGPRIVSSVDPLSKNVDVGVYLKEEE
ncbi:MAG: HD-GYP domain-containing protein [Thermodesulfobacteriota bacterium]